MATITIGYGKSLDSYHSKEITSPNLDINIKLENGEYLEINTRPHGFAVRRRTEKKSRITLLDIDY